MKGLNYSLDCIVKLSNYKDPNVKYLAAATVARATTQVVDTLYHDDPLVEPFISPKFVFPFDTHTGFNFSSKIDVILGCWVHCKLPSGGVFNATSLSAYLKPSTKAPHFLLDIIQTTPTSLVLLNDVTPRKDLNLFTDYLKTYYEDTQLDRHRQKLIQTLMADHQVQVKPYLSPSLYLRALLSPTAILHAIDTADDGTNGKLISIEEIIEHHVGPIAKELLQFWMDQSENYNVGEISDSTEMACLAERDRVIKNKTIFDDLGSKFPGMFGQDVADRVLGVLKEYYDK